MADISKCIGKDCPIKEKCYRFTAPTGIWQSWHSYKWTIEEGCDDFLDNKGYKNN